METHRRSEYDHIVASMAPDATDDPFDVYEALTGPEGTADFDRPVYGIAIALAYEVFVAFLVEEIVLWQNQQSSAMTPETREKLLSGQVDDLQAVYRQASIDLSTSERLGHASVSFTLDRYSHKVKGLQESAAERVAGLVFGDDSQTAP